MDCGIVRAEGKKRGEEKKENMSRLVLKKAERLKKSESEKKKKKRKGKEEAESSRKRKKKSPNQEFDESDEYGEEESMPPTQSTTAADESEFEKKNPDESEKKNPEATMSAKAKKKQRDRNRKKAKKKAAEKKAAKIFLNLKSTERYPKSWFSISKPMRSNLVLAIYWGPSWGNRLLNWFIHGGWPEDFTIAGPSKVPFERACDVRLFDEDLQNDLDKHWLEVNKHFHRDEWRKHGRRSGMVVEEYFATIMDLFMAVMEIGIDLQPGDVMPASDAKSSIEKKLRRVYMSALKKQQQGVAGGDGDSTLFIDELEFVIDMASYAIIAKPHKQPYSGHIKTGKDNVVLATESVLLDKEKKKGEE